MAIQMFNKVDPKYKRGHVEMIYKAANLMKEYDLEKDLDAYRMIFDLFPKVSYGCCKKHCCKELYLLLKS